MQVQMPRMPNAVSQPVAASPLYVFEKNRKLFPDSEFLNKLTVAIDITFCQIFEQSFSLTYHFEQCPSCGVIFFVCFEVVGNFFDPQSKKRHLTFDRSGIFFASSIFFKNLRFGFLRHVRHGNTDFILLLFFEVQS